MIDLFQPSVGAAELAAIERVFASRWLGTGSLVAEFERTFGAYLGRRPEEMLAITSCTEGLFQAIAALDLGPGDQVVLPAISFIGAAHAARSTGAEVVLCDVDPMTLNPTAAHVAKALTPSTRAVLILHYGGGPGSLAEIAKLTRDRGIALIEDAACSVGAFVDGAACGTFGDIGVWSFDSMKVMTTGDGGMLWCRDERLTARIRNAVRLGDGGSGFSRRGMSSRWWVVDPPLPGRRAAMNDLTAAIGLIQLARLPEFLERRNAVAARYDEALSDLVWLEIPESQLHQSARIFYWVQMAPADRDRLATYLLEHGIYTSFRYWPLHRTSLYASGSTFAGADRAAACTLNLPLHQGLSDTEVELVIDAIRAFVPSAVSR